jgi:hypothetical protein
LRYVYDLSSSNFSQDKPQLNLKGRGTFTDGNQSKKSCSIIVPDEVKRERDTTIVRVRTRKELCLKATPLLLLVFGCFEEDIRAMVRD